MPTITIAELLGIGKAKSEAMSVEDVGKAIKNASEEQKKILEEQAKALVDALLAMLGLLELYNTAMAIIPQVIKAKDIAMSATPVVGPAQGAALAGEQGLGLATKAVSEGKSLVVKTFLETKITI